MTLPYSPLSMSQINAEFGLGNDLNSYRSTAWWKDDSTSGSFPSSPISFSDFGGKRVGRPSISWTGSQVFDYTGGDQSYTIPAGATVLGIKCWGSDTSILADGSLNGADHFNGGGGYAYGVIVLGTLGLVAGNVLRIMVGGSDAVRANAGNITVTSPCPYGFGGTGNARSAPTRASMARSGGGLSGVFLPGGAITTSDVSGSNALIIAGGSGGGGVVSPSGSFKTWAQGGGGSGNSGSPQGSDGVIIAGTYHSTGGGGGGRNGGGVPYQSSGNAQSGYGGANYTHWSALDAWGASGDGAGNAGNSGDGDAGGKGSGGQPGRIVIYRN